MVHAKNLKFGMALGIWVSRTLDRGRVSVGREGAHFIKAGIASVIFLSLSLVLSLVLGRKKTIDKHTKRSMGKWADTKSSSRHI